MTHLGGIGMLSGGCHNVRKPLGCYDAREGTGRKSIDNKRVASVETAPETVSGHTRDIEDELGAFGEYLLRRRIFQEKAVPHCVRWVRRFLRQPVNPGAPLEERIEAFRECLLERCAYQDW